MRDSTIIFHLVLYCTASAILQVFGVVVIWLRHMKSHTDSPHIEDIWRVSNGQNTKKHPKTTWVQRPPLYAIPDHRSISYHRHTFRPSSGICLRWRRSLCRFPSHGGVTLTQKNLQTDSAWLSPDQPTTSWQWAFPSSCGPQRNCLCRLFTSSKASPRAMHSIAA